MVNFFGSFYACSENAVSVLAFVLSFSKGFDGGYMCVDFIRLIQEMGRPAVVPFRCTPFPLCSKPREVVNSLIDLV